MGNQRSREWAKTKEVEAQQVLRDVIERRHPDLLRLLIDRARVLTTDERFSIQSALCDELTANGLEKSGEPTGYGLIIEDLIDLVGTL